MIEGQGQNVSSALASFFCGHCIVRHSLRYFRYSGLVIYMSKLPAPSISMPCDYRILQSLTKEQVKFVLYETVWWSLFSSCIMLLPLRYLLASAVCKVFELTARK